MLESATIILNVAYPDPTVGKAYTLTLSNMIGYVRLSFVNGAIEPGASGRFQITADQVSTVREQLGELHDKLAYLATCASCHEPRLASAYQTLKFYSFDSYYQPSSGQGFLKITNQHPENTDATMLTTGTMNAPVALNYNALAMDGSSLAPSSVYLFTYPASDDHRASGIVTFTTAMSLADVGAVFAVNGVKFSFQTTATAVRATDIDIRLNTTLSTQAASLCQAIQNEQQINHALKDIEVDCSTPRSIVITAAHPGFAGNFIELYLAHANTGMMRLNGERIGVDPMPLATFYRGHLGYHPLPEHWDSEAAEPGATAS